MGTGTALYRVLLLAQIVAAIVGFGGLLTHSLYIAKARRVPPETARALLAATSAAARIASYAIFALAIIGAALIVVSDGALEFGDPWITASFAMWIGIVGVIQVLVRPATTGLAVRAESLADDLASAGTRTLADDTGASGLVARLWLGDGLVRLLLIGALALVIWQPT